MNALIIGATGLCGSAMVKYAAQDKEAFAKVYALSRSTIKDCPPSVENIVVEDGAQWAEKIPENIDVLLSALGTTKTAAGGIDAQYKIDHDLNVAVANAAKAKGCKIIALVSSVGADPGSHLAYFKMKGEIERDIAAIGFDRAFFLRPGALLGDRQKDHKGFGEKLSQGLGKMVYRGFLQPLLGYPIFGDEVGKVAVKLVSENQYKDQVRVFSSEELLNLSRDE